jgi:MFS family permease
LFKRNRREVVLLPKSPRLRRLLLAYTINEVGTWFGYVALAVGVYDATGSVIATTGLFLARGLMPALAAPVLVVRIERNPRPGALGALYLVEGLTMLGLAALIWRFWLPGVLILVALDGAAAATATALVRATAAHIAEEELPPGDAGSAIARDAAQRQANASLNVAYMVAFAAGPAIGGVIVKLSGGPLALILDAVTFFMCGLLLLDVRIRATPGQESVRSRLMGALRHVNAIPALRTLLITEAVAIVFFTAVEPVEVVYAKHTLSAGSLGLGLLLGFWGAGAALGALLFARWSGRALSQILIAGTALVGIGYFGFAAAPSIEVACGAALIGGLGNGIQWPALLSAVQRLTPSSLQGRMMGTVGSLNTLCPTLGFAIGGTITALSSTRVTMLFAGAVAALSVIVFMRLPLERALRPSDDREGQPAQAVAP